MTLKLSHPEAVSDAAARRGLFCAAQYDSNHTDVCMYCLVSNSGLQGSRRKEKDKSMHTRLFSLIRRGVRLVRRPYYESPLPSDVLGSRSHDLGVVEED